MNKEFVSYEQALTLKELGFDEQCFMVWDSPRTMIPDHEAGSNATNVDAPLKQQVLRWFREKHKLLAIIHQSGDENDKYTFRVYETQYPHMTVGRGDEYNYDDAEDDCINKLIEIVKSK